MHAALGDALRMAERFPEAVAAYTRAIDAIAEPKPAHWVLYYTRGIANERAGDWPAAEADFREALELEPDQPLVLNYLGYSMVEKSENLDEALGMIEAPSRASPTTATSPTRSAGCYYRLGRYEEAVPPMLRAVELTPDDPVINDHLGDVLWKVGRKREAEFQWRRALSFGPADDLDMDRIRASSRSASTRCSAEPSRRTAERASPRPRARAGQGQPRAARHRPARRRLPPARQPRGLPAVGDGSRPSPPPGLSWPSTGRSPATSAQAPTTWCCAPRTCSPRRPAAGAALRLTKTLPVASGIGGGSADAAAALRLLARLWERALPAAAALLALGADVPVCLAGRACRMRGIGEELDARWRCRPSGWCWSIPACRSRPAAVFAALAAPRQPAARPTRRLSRRRRLGGWLAAQRNDLEPPAAALAPAVGDVLAALAAQPGCRLARMSGSGATCFGFFTAQPRARRRRRPPAQGPAWWITAGPVDP